MAALERDEGARDVRPDDPALADERDDGFFVADDVRAEDPEGDLPDPLLGARVAALEVRAILARVPTIHAGPVCHTRHACRTSDPLTWEYAEKA